MENLPLNPECVMVAGGGAREHALAWRFAQSTPRPRILTTTAKFGAEEYSTNVPGVQQDDPTSLLAAAKDNDADLVIIGGETPLALGVADLMRAAGIAVFGPNADCAQLEASKSWAKQFMVDCGVPTARFRVFTDVEAAAAHCAQLEDGSYVIKEDGLRAGKGVTLPANSADARSELEKIYTRAPNSGVVIEERLRGYEVSLFSFVADNKLVGNLTAYDYKRAYDGDLGPNTGGMGCYSAPDALPYGTLEQALERIVTPVLDGLSHRGMSYSGVLYSGLMITAEGPQVLEFNVRFGDPECQALMTLLEGDFAALCGAVACGDADGAQFGQTGSCAVAVVMAAEGYPHASRPGAPIGNLAAAAEHATIFHAGTKSTAEGVEATGGRALTLVGTGSTLQVARQKAYDAVELVDFPGALYRRDIAAKERKAV